MIPLPITENLIHPLPYQTKDNPLSDKTSAPHIGYVHILRIPFYRFLSFLGEKTVGKPSMSALNSF